jgi:hypothetical protein
MKQKKKSAKGQRFRIIAAGAIIIIVATVAILAYILLQPPPLTIRIEPANVSVRTYPVGSTFTVNVTVENAVDITAIQLDVRYDPSVLMVTSLSEGQFLESVGEIVTLVNYTAQSMNNTLLERVFYADTVAEGVPNWSGSGTLITITFKVTSNWTSSIQLYPFTENSNFNEGTYLLRAVNRSLSNPQYTNLIPVLDSGSYS